MKSPCGSKKDCSERPSIERRTRMLVAAQPKIRSRNANTQPVPPKPRAPNENISFGAANTALLEWNAIFS